MQILWGFSARSHEVRHGMPVQLFHSTKMRLGFGNALRIRGSGWIDTSNGKKVCELEGSVEEFNALRVLRVGVFVLPLLA